MGGITLDTLGKKTSSAMNMYDDMFNSKRTYRNLVAQADEQAKRVLEQAPEEERYLLQSAAERSRERQRRLQQEASAQKTQLAAAGLTRESATVQQIIQNKQLAALLAEQSDRADFANTLQQSRQETAEKIRQIQEKKDSYFQDYRQRNSKWKLGSKLLSFFTKN